MIKTIDKDGLLLSKIQGDIFLKSLKEVNTSSDVFIRRFMNSTIVKSLDSKAFLDDSISDNEVFNELNNEYGNLTYGSNKYSKETIYWIGYIYRYMAYLYNLSSKQVYNIVKPKELNEMYYVYHTLDPKEAINNIFLEKDISFDEEDLNKKLFSLLRTYKYEKELSLNLINDKDNLIFNISYNDHPSIGEIVLSNYNNNKYFEIDISFNDDRYRNNDLIITLLNKLMNYIKNNLDTDSKPLLFETNKDNDDLIAKLKKIDFKYIGEDENSIKMLKK